MDSSGRQSPSGWDGTMKSLLNEALARHQEAEAKEERESEKAKAVEKKKNEEEIRDFLRGAHVVFITAGMGGGTGTGSAQYVARVAKEEGALTMGVVTMPFKSEGRIRMENAEAGLDKLRKFSDTTIVIYNDKLLELVPRLPINAAFKVADEILMQSIKGMTEIITKPGLVNLDYADLMTIMKGGGVAMIGIGESEEERDRIDYAINEALESPLLGEVDLTHARGALVREPVPARVARHCVPGRRSPALPLRGSSRSAADDITSTVARGLRTFIGPRPDNPSRKGRGDPRAECHRNARGRIGPRDDRWDLRDDSRGDSQVSEPAGQSAENPKRTLISDRLISGPRFIICSRARWRTTARLRSSAPTAACSRWSTLAWRSRAATPPWV